MCKKNARAEGVLFFYVCCLYTGMKALADTDSGRGWLGFVPFLQGARADTSGDGCNCESMQ